MSIVASLHEKSDTPIELLRKKKKKEPGRPHGRWDTPNSRKKVKHTHTHTHIHTHSLTHTHTPTYTHKHTHTHSLTLALHS